MSWDPELGDEPAPAWRDHAPDPLAPIDPEAPVSGHRPAETAPAGGATAALAPEQDWTAASRIIMPILRPPGTSGTRLATLDAAQLAAEGLRSHASPLVDDGPCGLQIGYVLRVGTFDVLVNADHLLAWGTTPAAVRGAAMANLGIWSAGAPWTDEVSGHRRLVSSATGDGGDAARVLLPEVRAHLTAELAAGARVLIGVPERDLLVAASLYAGDDDFAALFAAFVRDHASGAHEPLDDRVHELVDGELRPFVG
jgi:hypothetical protein